MAEHQIDAPRPQGMQEPEKQGRGCFFWGCMITLALLLVIAIAVGIGGYMVYSKVVGAVLPYTSEEAVELPAVKSSPGQYAEIEKRVNAFTKAVNADEKAELALTADEINILISEHPNCSWLKGVIFVKIEDDQIKADLSVPLGEVPFVSMSPALKNRYFNASGSVKVFLRNGMLVVAPEALSVRGEPIPEKDMKEGRKLNLARNAYKNQENMEFIGKLESIDVEDGKIVIRSRGGK